MLYSRQPFSLEVQPDDGLLEAETCSWLTVTIIRALSLSLSLSLSIYIYIYIYIYIIQLCFDFQASAV